MSRFTFSAALMAALLTTTAQVSTAALADDLPLDSFPFGVSHQTVHKKVKVAAHVPAEGELVPLQMPREASAKRHHGKSTHTPVPDAAFAGDVNVDKAFAAPAVLAAAAIAAPAAPVGAPIIRLAGGPTQSASPTATTPTPLPTAPSGAATLAPTAVPLAAPPNYSGHATAPSSTAPGLSVPPPVTGHPLKASLTAATGSPDLAPAELPSPSVVSGTGSFQTANLPSATNRNTASLSPDLVDALPYGVSLARPQAAAGQNSSSAASGTSAAQPAPPPPAHNMISPVRNTLTLEAGLGRVIELAGSTASVFAADPKVAEVRPASATSLFVFGVAAGRTTIAALDSNGRPVAQYDVVVVPSAYTAGATRASLSHVLPGHNLHLDQLGNGLQVDGQVANPAEAERAMAVARGFLATGETASNRLNVNSNVQVNLKVRIAEMSRSVTRDLGLNWNAMADLGKYATFSSSTANLLNGLTQSPAFAQILHKPNGKVGIDAILEALAQDQLVHSLAEPNLTAMSGETASFLVGGEFPIPVAQQNNQTTIEFKQYGVSLAFVPTVISEGHISLKVRPEVSQLTTQGAITLSSSNSSFQIPALSVRRAETTVELGSGQSFAIAGLLQDASTISDTAVPFLGELPILGALFRSDAYLRNETELVIIVTPYIVRPVSNPSALALSTDGNPVPDDYDRLVLTRQIGRTAAQKAAAGAPASAPANGGFVVQ